MELVYGALLLHAAKQKINEENMKKILTAANVKVDEAKIKALIASLEGVNIEEVISKATMPVAAPATATPAKEEEKKEEEDTEKKAEKAVEGLSSLF